MEWLSCIRKTIDIIEADLTENISVAEIAKRMGASEGKIKMQLCRTRQKLKEYLCKEGISL